MQVSCRSLASSAHGSVVLGQQGGQIRERERTEGRRAEASVI